MCEAPVTDSEPPSLLAQVQTPADIKEFSPQQLRQLADELRAETIDAVSVTGGHLGAGLGVVELTVALHHVFDTPRDRLVWDVGHQTYPHKILTGRRARIRTLRKAGGLSGFTRRAESIYDPFGAAHSSTAISAGLGMAAARDIAKGDHHVVAVVGDGAMSAGMAYEAMNNAGTLGSNLIVILNDNDMSIAPPVGAMSHYLSRLLSSRQFLSLRDIGMRFAQKLPERMEIAAQKMDEYARGMLTGGTLFEELGFYYIGPVDGHNLDHLLPVLKNIKEATSRLGPVLLHVVTRKGCGYPPAEQAQDKYHGVSEFNVITGVQSKSPANAPTYTQVFGSTLSTLAHADERIVAITAAMPAGTGMDVFQKAHPERFFDVGIAEQHAVTFAAGMACEGMVPFVGIYSTFLQRAYDQIVHDVAIQSLPVRFAIDRAGLVGADGATHAGAFDITFLCCLPHFVVMAAADEAELVHMLATAHAIDDRPSALRYPRGAALGVELPPTPQPLEPGRGRIVREGRSAAVLSFGARLAAVLEAADSLARSGISLTVADARFAKPLDTDLLAELVHHHDIVFSIEEGAVGGFAAQVMDALLRHNLQAAARFHPLYFPDRFVEHDTPGNQYRSIGMDPQGLAQTIAAAITASVSGASGAPGITEAPAVPGARRG